jgi:beta-glucanase (GH16 family)
MSIQRTHFRVALACMTIILGLLAIAVSPAAAGTAGHGHAKAATHKKGKCKKRRGATQKCKRAASSGSAQVSTAPATAPSPALADDACGARIPKGTGGYWECTFWDDFNGGSLDRTKWIPQQTATSGYLSGPTACFVDNPNNVSVSDGSLKLTARQEPAPIGCGAAFATQYTSGMVSTAGGRFSQTYGRFEIRAKVPPAQVKGLQSSLWLWPVNASRYGQYPASGEIDIAEMYSQYPDRAIPYIHYKAAAPDPNVTNNYCMISNLAAYHTYALEWTASTLKITYDGKTCLVDNWNPAAPLIKPAPFDQPFFIALTQALGIGTNQFDAATTPLPATTTVDYVRVWR